jgi:hypothetical protein
MAGLRALLAAAAAALALAAALGSASAEAVVAPLAAAAVDPALAAAPAVAAEEGADAPAADGSAAGLGIGLGQHTLVGAVTGWFNVTADGFFSLADTASCGASLQTRYNCSEEACEDLVPGYINYLDFFYCDAGNTGARVFAFLLLLVWMVFLLQLVESTTNE